MSVFKKAGIPLIAITAMIAGFWLSFVISKNTDNVLDIDTIQGTILPVARNIAVPELFKDDGSIFTNKDIQGHWTLIFFGYTNCPDICPATLGVLAEAKKVFGRTFPEANFPKVIFVSVDPSRDTLKILGDYTHYFDSEFVGVTGPSKLLEALTLQMSVVYMQVADSDSDKANYAVDHSSSILMINPEGKLQAFLKAPHSVTSIVESVEALIN